MEEVIARKKTSLGIGYIAMIVIGVALGGICIALGIINETMGAVYVGIAIGLIFIAVGVWQTVVFFKYPKDIIVYSEGTLKLANLYSCSPLDITGTKRIVTRRNGIVDRWGKLEITLSDGRKFTLKYVDYVEAVQERLGALKAQCYDEMMQKQAEAEAAAHPAPEAPKTENEAPKTENEAPKTENEDPFGL